MLVVLNPLASQGKSPRLGLQQPNLPSPRLPCPPLNTSSDQHELLIYMCLVSIEMNTCLACTSTNSPVQSRQWHTIHHCTITNTDRCVRSILLTHRYADVGALYCPFFINVFPCVQVHASCCCHNQLKAHSAVATVLCLGAAAAIGRCRGTTTTPPACRGATHACIAQINQHMQRSKCVQFILVCVCARCELSGRSRGRHQWTSPLLRPAGTHTHTCKTHKFIQTDSLLHVKQQYNNARGVNSDSVCQEIHLAPSRSQSTNSDAHQAQNQCVAACMASAAVAVGQHKL